MHAKSTMSYCLALICPTPAVRELAAAAGLPDSATWEELCASDAVAKLVLDDLTLAAKAAKLNKFETPKKCILIDDEFSVENEMMTAVRAELSDGSSQAPPRPLPTAEPPRFHTPWHTFPHRCASSSASPSTTSTRPRSTPSIYRQAHGPGRRCLHRLTPWHAAPGESGARAASGLHRAGRRTSHHWSMSLDGAGVPPAWRLETARLAVCRWDGRRRGFAFQAPASGSARMPHRDTRQTRGLSIPADYIEVSDSRATGREPSPVPRSSGGRAGHVFHFVVGTGFAREAELEMYTYSVSPNSNTCETTRRYP